MSRSATRHRRNRWPQSLTSAYDLNVLADPNLVAYLPLAGHTNDWSGNGHNAVPYGGPGTGTFLDGSGCLAFNGVDQYLEFANHPALSVPDDGPGTGSGELFFEFWFSPAVNDFDDAEGTGPYVYLGGKLRDPGIVGEKDEYAFRMYNLTNTVGRPNRVSGYAFPPQALVPGTSNLGAGSYFQDAVVPDGWIYYGLAINTNDTSTHAGGFTEISKNGIPRDKDGLLNPYGVVPEHGDAPLRFATATLDSFFEGRIAKLAIYRTVPSHAEHHARYRLIVPAVTGSIHLFRDVGVVEKTTSGTKCTIPVGPSGVPAGATNIVNVAHAYTAGQPSVGDSKGNVYTVTRTSANTGLTMRETEFSAPIHAALEDGDAVQATLTAAVDRRTMGVDAYTGIDFASPVDKTNSGQGTSITPGTATFTGTTNQADELVHAAMVVARPSTDAFTGDTVGEFTDLTPVGTNTGTLDITLHRAFKSVDEISSFRWQPGLDPDEAAPNWLETIATYFAGDSTPTPPTVGSGRWIDAVGEADLTASGTTLPITVGGDGVPVGHTIAVWVHADYTVAGATCTDDAGNTYVRHLTIPASGNTSRMALFLAEVTTAVVPTDVITVTFPVAVTRRVATAHEFSGVLIPVVMDASNNNSNTGLAPFTAGPTTSHADSVLLGFVCVEGPVEQSAGFEPDITRQWTHLPAVGTTGAGTSSDDRTIYPAFRIVAATGAYPHGPALGTSAKYVVGVGAFNAG